MVLTCEDLRQELQQFAEEVFRQEIEDLRGHVADIREKVREDLRDALRSCRGRSVGIPAVPPPRLAVRRHAAGFTKGLAVAALPELDDADWKDGIEDEDMMFVKNMKVYEDMVDSHRRKHLKARKKHASSNKTRTDSGHLSHLSGPARTDSGHSGHRPPAPPTPSAVASPTAAHGAGAAAASAGVASPAAPPKAMQHPEPPKSPKIDFPAPPATPATTAAAATADEDDLALPGVPGSPLSRQRSHSGMSGTYNGHVPGIRTSVGSIEDKAALKTYQNPEDERLRSAGDGTLRAWGSQWSCKTPRPSSPASPTSPSMARRPSISSTVSATNSSGRRRPSASSVQSSQASRDLEELRAPPSNCVQKVWNDVDDFVRSAFFDYVSGTLVVLNAISLGWQTDWQARNLTEESTVGFRLVEIFFCLSFTVELLLRLGVYQRAFFDIRDVKWNLFDTLLVSTQLAEEIVRISVFGRFDLTGADSSGGSGSMGDLSILRVLRILRLVRIMRVMRILRLIGDLRTLVMSILGSLKSLVWAVVLLFVMMYVIGVYLTQLVLDHRLQDHEDEDAILSLVTLYGSVGDSVFVLFEAVTGGIDWGEAVGPLRSEISGLLVPLFMLYISFVVLCMLNVITGVFVESALLTARRDKDIYMVNHARQLFAQVDSAHTGTISWEQFETSLESEDMREVFKQLDLDISEAAGLFQLLDTDRTGNIDAGEFINGCTRLRGPAKALDLNLLKMQTRLHWEKMMKHQSRMERTLGQLSLSLSVIVPEVGEQEVYYTSQQSESETEDPLDAPWLDRQPIPHLGSHKDARNEARAARARGAAVAAARGQVYYVSHSEADFEDPPEAPWLDRHPLPHLAYAGDARQNEAYPPYGGEVEV